jgi:hypothetical protein
MTQQGLLPSVPPVIGGLGTKPRWDKYDPYVGNFRGPLALDATLDMANLILAVGINSSGAVVVGAGQTGLVGVIIMPVGVDIHGYLLEPPLAGDIVDVGKYGEITNFVLTKWTSGSPGSFSVDTTAPAAGTAYYAHADGSVNATAGAGSVPVGHTVESSRLIVAFGHGLPATS